MLPALLMMMAILRDSSPARPYSASTTSWYVQWCVSCDNLRRAMRRRNVRWEQTAQTQVVGQRRVAVRTARAGVAGEQNTNWAWQASPTLAGVAGQPSTHSLDQGLK